MELNLPHDLIMEVLLWLPVKSLLRFRCVSKSWCEIIHSRNFIYSHLRTSSDNRRNRKLIHSLPQNSDLVVIHAIDINDGFEEEEEFHLNYNHHIWLEAYCNGLILLDQFDYKFSVLNPSTRHCRELPDLPVDYDKINQTTYSTGFGYDATADDYKVVLLISSPPSYHVWIFGLNSSSCWKRIQDFPFIEYNFIKPANNGNSFVDGCVHFLCSIYGDAPYIIAAFDVAKETFSVVPIPTYQGEEGYNVCMQDFEGCLSINFCTYEKADFYVRRKKQLEGVIEFTWTKLYSFTIEQFDKIGTRRSISIYYTRTLGYSKEGDKILFFHILQGCIRMILKKQVLKKSKCQILTVGILFSAMKVLYR